MWTVRITEAEFQLLMGGKTLEKMLTVGGLLSISAVFTTTGSEMPSRNLLVRSFSLDCITITYLDEKESGFGIRGLVLGAKRPPTEL